MYKRIFIAVFFLINILSFSGVYFIDITKEPIEFNSINLSEKLYIDIEQFAEYFNLRKYPSKNIIYISNPENNDILELDLIKGTARINFNINKSYSSAVFEKNEKLYVLIDAISDFYNFKSFKLDNTFIYRSVPRIIKIEFSFNKIIFSLSHIINENMIKIENDGIVIYPAINEYPVPQDIDFFIVSDNVVKYKIKNLNNYDLTISNRNIILNLNENKISNNEEVVQTPENSEPQNTVENVETPKASPLEEKLNEIKKEQSLKEQSLKEESTTIDTELLKVENKMVDLNGRIIPVHIARINPKELEIKIVFNNLGATKDAEEFLNELNPILAINAGYFDVSLVEPIGKIISNGKIQHISPYYRPSFILDQYGNPYIKNVVMEYKIYIKEVPFWIKAINTAWKGDVKLYTSEYKGEIKESENDYLFLLIENSYIIKIGKEKPINDQKLLLIERKYLKYIPDLEEGEEVIFDIDINQNIAIKEMVEGGPLLLTDDLMQEALKEEKLSYSSSIISRKTPRTIVAIDNENMVLFIVVDGYMESNPGINYDEAQLLLEKIGNIKQAMMLDGGSSSLFYYNGKFLNYRSENWRNRIPVFLGVFKKK
ncbi:phosphodiester glycosidase family protein [Marinitoga litoralis]|uniref:phosphodiester glycosidase family protein n=1 Tax=Marinitoga litoralis TaxID=570855 RepID=UPI00196216C6|nr:phosphodiester glycosidase family protein [Marinitoga litoralis]MBM7559862.1 exopolysaccharide biosynthesis protein [Marinitoga litoralis]